MAGAEVKLTFVPHLAPMVRGIHATLFAKLTSTSADLRGIFQDCYRDEPFVVLTDGDYEPETRHVAGTNRCEIDVTRPEGDTVVVTVAIDNLVKGASGQAIQAMNLMHGFDETLGLESPAVIPKSMSQADIKTVVKRVNLVRQRQLRIAIFSFVVIVTGVVYYLGYQNGFDDRVPLVLDEAGLKARISKLRRVCR